MYIHMHGHCSVAMDTMYRVRLATDGVREGGGVHGVQNTVGSSYFKETRRPIGRRQSCRIVHVRNHKN